MTPLHIRQSDWNFHPSGSYSPSLLEWGYYVSDLRSLLFRGSDPTPTLRLPSTGSVFSVYSTVRSAQQRKEQNREPLPSFC